MRFFRKIPFVILFILLLVAEVGDIFAAPSPEIVKVGIQLLSIDQPDLYKGTYAMDFHLRLFCSKTCPKFTFEVTNGKIQNLTTDIDLPDCKVYRMKVDLQENFNAQDYPFDSYWLKLKLKDQKLNASKLIFVADPLQTKIGSEVILHGWNYHSKKVAVTKFIENPFAKVPFSQYIFSIRLERPFLMGFMKVIFPAIIIMLFAFISFVIKPDKSLNRFGIVSGALLGSVIFHLNLTSSLPPFGYLTFTDMFMIGNYVILLIILFENVYVMRLADMGKQELAGEIDKVCIVAFPILWMLLQGVNLFYFFVILRL